MRTRPARRERRAFSFPLSYLSSFAKIFLNFQFQFFNLPVCFTSKCSYSGMPCIGAHDASVPTRNARSKNPREIIVKTQETFVPGTPTNPYWVLNANSELHRMDATEKNLYRPPVPRVNRPRLLPWTPPSTTQIWLQAQWRAALAI